MVWIASTPCRSGPCDGPHRLAHDGPRPPEPADHWHYICPISKRLVRVKVEALQWEWRRPEQCPYFCALLQFELTRHDEARPPY